MVRGLQQLPATNALPPPPPVAAPAAMASSAGGAHRSALGYPLSMAAGRPYIKSGGIICGRRSTKPRSKTYVSPYSVSPLGQGAALCRLTNGCRVSKFTCLSFYFSRNTCQNHTTCSCSSRRFVHYMRRVQTGGRMTRHSGCFVRLTTGGWESVCWYLWMNASESRPAATPSGAPFRSTGKASWGNAKWPSTKTCFAFDRAEVCNAATCRYTHTHV